MTKPGKMETLRDAVARLEGRGFIQSLRATSDGRLEVEGQCYDPEDLLVEETVRFEGSSDPEAQAVLFALRSRDDHVRGTFIANFGPQADPAAAAVMQRLAPIGSGTIRTR